jgi:Spy/CpxP family protein refolding chaperone
MLKTLLAAFVLVSTLAITTESASACGWRHHHHCHHYWRHHHRHW